MISKFVSVSIVIWILSNCFANCLEYCGHWLMQQSSENTAHFSRPGPLCASDLEFLHIFAGQFNLSASIFASAPELKGLSIYGDVVHIDPQAFSGGSVLRMLQLNITLNATLPEGLFDGLTNLQVLDLYRRVYDQETYTFNNINEIDIKNLRIPADNNIKWLRLSEGNITELKSEMFVNFTQLAILSVVLNRIERIRPYTFESMNQLMVLDLEHNKIEEITQAMLSGLTNLRAASFMWNNIRQIEGDAFSSTPQLRRLDLSKNNIVTLEPHTFNSLVKIYHLNFSQSQDYRSPVDLNLFCNLPNLSYLDLHDRGISMLIKCVQNDTLIDLGPEETPFNTTMSEDVFSEWRHLCKMDYIRKIDLGSIAGLNKLWPLFEPQNISIGGRSLATFDLHLNNLSDWEDNLFDNFVNLKLLNLEHNPIRSLRSGQFNGLGNLLILRLSNCYLTSLDFNVFSPLTNLEELHLTNNGITTMTPPEMSMNRLVVLDLSSNLFPKTSLDTEAFRSAFNWTELGLHRYGN